MTELHSLLVPTPAPSPRALEPLRFDMDSLGSCIGAEVGEIPRLPRISEIVRLPNMDWVKFLDGDLSDEDWKLIERVERGEISVDEAMAGRCPSGPRCRASHGAASVSALRASIDYREDDDFDDYEDGEIGCINCYAGWRHGCCDDLCRGSNEPQDCDYARKCLVCNKYGEIL